MWRVAIAVTSGLIVGAGAALLYGAWSWRKRTDDLHARLFASQTPSAPAKYDPRQIADLPPPVRRYFQAVLREGRPLAAAARFTHAGTFNMGEEEPDWRPFSSTQVATFRPPGFVWDARVRMAPGIDAFVHDAYVAGEGILHARVLGLVPVADVRGTPEAAAGELLRYLAEAMWYPTALLPGQGIRWTAIDERSARATLSDRGTTVSLDFTFGPDGLIESTSSPGRPRTVGSAIVNTAWRGRAWAYEERGGMRIPIEAEVAWVLPSGPYPYWRGRIASIDYEYAGGDVTGRSGR